MLGICIRVELRFLMNDHGKVNFQCQILLFSSELSGWIEKYFNPCHFQLQIIYIQYTGECFCLTYFSAFLRIIHLVIYFKADVAFEHVFLFIVNKSYLLKLYVKLLKTSIQ